MELFKILEELSGLLNNYEEYKERAVKLKWIEIQELHVDWFKIYPLGITIDVLHFPKDYICKNLKDAYVRSVLSSMAYFEEWESDFWNMSEDNRREIFNIAELGKYDVYRTYFELQDLRLKAITSEFLVKEMQYYAEKNNIEKREVQKYCEMVSNALCIELGGCYLGDYRYLAIQEDTLIFIDCGVWD